MARKTKATISVNELDILSVIKLMQQYNVSQRTIYRYKKAAGLCQEQSSYRPDLSVLSTWNQISAYLLGLFAADGCIVSGRPTSVLSMKDKAYLQTISDLLHLDHRPLIHGSGNVWVLQMAGGLTRQWCAFGMTPRKSRTMQWPKVPIVLESHFIRGYFDGDGTVYEMDKKHRKTPLLRVAFCTGSEGFAQALKARLKHHGIHAGINKIKPKKNSGPCYHISIWRKNAVCQTYQFFYANATLFLERKRMVFESYYATYPSPKVGRPKGCKWSNAERKKRMESYYANIPTEEELRELYWNQGLTQQEVGHIFKCSREKVRRWMQRYSIPRRPRFSKPNKSLGLRQTIEIPTEEEADAYSKM